MEPRISCQKPFRFDERRAISWKVASGENEQSPARGVDFQQMNMGSTLSRVFNGYGILNLLVTHWTLTLQDCFKMYMLVSVLMMKLTGMMTVKLAKDDQKLENSV